MEVTKKSFSFPKKHDMPLYFVSAADGTNVVRLFRDAIRLAQAYRTGDTQDFVDQILRELEVREEPTLFRPNFSQGWECAQSKLAIDILHLLELSLVESETLWEDSMSRRMLSLMPAFE